MHEEMTRTAQPDSMDEFFSQDPQVYQLIKDETERQSTKIRLIASENYVSRAVRFAESSVFMNKYSEGYPGKRYYEGQQFTDQLEALAQRRAMSLFGTTHANVQPYSGSPANLAIYLALLTPGDKVMGLSLPHGGHLTHGWSVSITGKWFQPVPYYVNPSTGRVDLDEVRTIALKERPKLIFCGGTAIPRQIDFPGFAAVAKEAGALLVADIAHIAGLVAGGAHPTPVGHVDVVSTTTHKTLRGPRGAMLLASPDYADKIDRAVFPGLQGGPHMHTIGAIAVALHEAAQPDFKRYAHQIVKNASALAESLLERGFNLVSGGTDNHLILVDLQNRQVGGKAVAHALDEAGLVCNYNTVPNDPRKPRDPSGIRLGTAAATTRGMTETEMRLIAGWIDTVVNAVAAENSGPIEAVKQAVTSLAGEFPVP